MTVKTVFFGTPEFAVPSLSAMVNSDLIDVSLVVTQPDRPAGRGRKLTSPAVKLAADELNIPSIQPDSVSSQEVLTALYAATPDLLVVVAYGEILSQEVLNTAAYRAINVHPSLLPKYRGSTPIQASIMNGDSETGVSFIRLTDRLDAGPVLSQYVVKINDDATTGTLMEDLAVVAADHICDICIEMVAGTIVMKVQDETQATYTREWRREHAHLDWSASSIELERLVRASQPWPVAWTMLNGQPFRIHQVRISTCTSSVTPGLVRLEDGFVAVSTGSGILILEEVQPPGKRVMPATDWWNGLQTASLVFENA